MQHLVPDTAKVLLFIFTAFKIFNTGQQSTVLPSYIREENMIMWSKENQYMHGHQRKLDQIQNTENNYVQKQQRLGNIGKNAKKILRNLCSKSFWLGRLLR